MSGGGPAGHRCISGYAAVLSGELVVVLTPLFVPAGRCMCMYQQRQGLAVGSLRCVAVLVISCKAHMPTCRLGQRLASGVVVWLGYHHVTGSCLLIILGVPLTFLLDLICLASFVPRVGT